MEHLNYLKIDFNYYNIIGLDSIFRNDLSHKLYSEMKMHACFVVHKNKPLFMNTYNDTVKQKCKHVYFGLH